jgi:hypothetical protein
MTAYDIDNLRQRVDLAIFHNKKSIELTTDEVYALFELLDDPPREPAVYDHHSADCEQCVDLESSYVESKEAITALEQVNARMEDRLAILHEQIDKFVNTP